MTPIKNNRKLPQQNMFMEFALPLNNDHAIQIEVLPRLNIFSFFL